MYEPQAVLGLAHMCHCKRFLRVVGFLFPCRIAGPVVGAIIPYILGFLLSLVIVPAVTSVRTFVAVKIKVRVMATDRGVIVPALQLMKVSEVALP